MVCVLNKNGKPLMPTKRRGKARRLLKDGMAEVARLEPSAIQLL
ncbi:MAG: RRXRR domain-containing protein, partial [Clostridiales bacterium]|nr:RRXRR domain-containing protein [Clostridiales bacterium]